MGNINTHTHTHTHTRCDTMQRKYNDSILFFGAQVKAAFEALCHLTLALPCPRAEFTPQLHSDHNRVRCHPIKYHRDEEKKSRSEGEKKGGDEIESKGKTGCIRERVKGRKKERAGVKMILSKKVSFVIYGRCDGVGC